MEQFINDLETRTDDDVTLVNTVNKMKERVHQWSRKNKTDDVMKAFVELTTNILDNKKKNITQFSIL